MTRVLSDPIRTIRNNAGRGTVLLVAFLFAMAVGGGLIYKLGPRGDGSAPPGASQKAEKYTCGMHPFIISDKPGDCPICGMKLTKVEDTAAAPAAAPPSAAPAAKPAPAEKPAAKGGDFFADLEKKPAEDFFADLSGKPATAKKKLLFYRNPMNPAITSPVPMKDEMGMDYVPVYEEEAPAIAPGQPVEGRVAVHIGPEALQSAGVQTAPAQTEAIRRTVRTVGIVTADETRIRHVHTKVDGWVETLRVNFRGQLVEKGQPILSIYSPTLLAGQEEYLRARETAAKFATNKDEALQRLGKQLFDSARKRLELFDVPPEFIAELDRAGTVSRAVTLNAPVAGFVTAKGIFEGQQVEPGMELFTVTDLSRVWIEADLYEYEAREVQMGQEATLTLPYDPSVRMTGRVTYVNPFLTPESRTLKVRFEFENPDLVLKPAMYADVTLALAAGEGVVIPDSALMDTGVRKLVFVRMSEDTFEPREVRVGIRGDGKAQVLQGVKAGEEVVVKANFLIDSESRLRGAIMQQMIGK